MKHNEYLNLLEETKKENTRLKERIDLLVNCVEGGCNDDHLISEVKKIAGRAK